MIDPKSVPQLIHDQLDGLLDEETERELESFIVNSLEDYRLQQKLRRMNILLPLVQTETPGKDYFQELGENIRQAVADLPPDQSERKPSNADRKIVPFEGRHWSTSPAMIGAAALVAMMLTLGGLQMLNRRPSGDPIPPSSPLPTLSTQPQQGLLMIDLSENPTPIVQVIDLPEQMRELERWFEIQRATDPYGSFPDIKVSEYPIRTLPPPEPEPDYPF